MLLREGRLRSTIKLQYNTNIKISINIDEQHVINVDTGNRHWELTAKLSTKSCFLSYDLQGAEFLEGPLLQAIPPLRNKISRPEACPTKRDPSGEADRNLKGN